MRRKERVKELLSQLKQRYAAAAETAGSRAAESEAAIPDEEALAEMCRIMRLSPPLPGGSRVHKALVSWYVPRSVDDVDCFAKRYRVWRLLPAMITEILRKRREQQ